MLIRTCIWHLHMVVLALKASKTAMAGYRYTACHAKLKLHSGQPCVAAGCRGAFYINYEELEELGEGAFGKAVKCRRRRDNQMFVCKIMHESKMSDKAREEVGTVSLYIANAS